MAKYRKLPVIIEAVQVTDEWFDGDHPNDLHPIDILIDPVGRHVEIATLEGTMIARVGDWIITGVKGERYPCKPDIFAETYEAVDDETRPDELAKLRAALTAWLRRHAPSATEIRRAAEEWRPLLDAMSRASGAQVIARLASEIDEIDELRALMAEYDRAPDAS